MARAILTRERIDVSQMEADAGTDAKGAVCAFIGQTRNNARGREVAYLIYDAYEPLAIKELQRIAEEAESRWPCAVFITHRLGRVDSGSASVAVVVGSPHRAEAFEACRWCIDTLKQSVPIWKKEVCPDGTFWIEGESAIPSV